MDDHRERHTVHLVVDHLIWCPKRCRKVLVGPVRDRLEQIIGEVGDESGWQILHRAIPAMPPVLSAERVASTIVRMAERPRREVFVGLAARQFWMQYMLAPGLTERVFAFMADKLQLAVDQTAPASQGSLYQPMQEGAGISGGWKTTSGAQKGQTPGQATLLAAGLSALTLVAASALTVSALTVSARRALREG